MIVVARFNEDVTWLEQLNHEVVVYNKGTPVPGWINIENKGREGETFLRYILENYHKLPELVGFVQGRPFDHCPDTVSVINSARGFQPIGKMCLDPPGDCGWTDGINETLQKIMGIKRKRLEFCGGAQYMVPREMIRSKPFQWWKSTYSLYNAHHASPWVFERLWPYIWEYKTVLHL